MAKKVLTPTIAKALAQMVRDNLIKESTSITNELKKRINKDPLFKRYVKNQEKIQELKETKAVLEKEFKEKYSNDKIAVSINTYSTRPEDFVSIREVDKSKLSIDAIKERILLEDYLNQSGETLEEIVERLTTTLKKEILNP